VWDLVGLALTTESASLQLATWAWRRSLKVSRTATEWICTSSSRPCPQLLQSQPTVFHMDLHIARLLPWLTARFSRSRKPWQQSEWCPVWESDNQSLWDHT
jgi:hypothetical protein